MQFGKRALVGLALTIGVLAAACAPEQPSPGPSPAPGIPGAQMSPTAATTPSPADIEATLTRITQFDQQLKQLAADNPSPDDLVNTVQDILTLMDYVTAYYPQMSTQQRAQALDGMTGILGDEISVVNTHARLFRATATAFAIAHPSATPSPSPQATSAPPAQSATATVVATGTPTAASTAGTPTPSPTAAATQAPPSPTAPMPSPTGASIVSQIAADLDAIRKDAVSLASGQPTDQDIVSLLGRMQADLSRMSQQFSSISDSDMVSLLNDMDSAVADLVLVVQTHTQQESSSIATPTPPATSTPPPTSAP